MSPTSTKITTMISPNIRPAKSPAKPQNKKRSTRTLLKPNKTKRRSRGITLKKAIMSTDLAANMTMDTTTSITNTAKKVTNIIIIPKCPK